MVGVAPKVEDRAVDLGQLVERRRLGVDRFALEVGCDGAGPRRAVETDDRDAGVEPGPQVARDRSRIQGRHDGPVARPVDVERPGEQLAADASGLRLGEHEELGQLADAVAEDGPRIPDRVAGGLVLGDPPRVTGCGEVVEQRPADVPRGWIASGGVRGTARALSEVVDGALEDVEAQA